MRPTLNIAKPKVRVLVEDHEVPGGEVVILLVRRSRRQWRQCAIRVLFELSGLLDNACYSTREWCITWHVNDAKAGE